MADERAIVLGQKLVQLTMPGVPDTYQGCEAPSYTLVDPDNRRPVDFDAHAALLAGPPRPGDLAWEKLMLTRTVLRLRREHPEWFGAGGAYEPLPSATGATLAFRRGGHIVVAIPVRGKDLDPADVSLPPSFRPVLAGLPFALLIE
jgi:(1->4)-alpha-D-glucan 1-alpha-D-glucosylmutase